MPVTDALMALGNVTIPLVPETPPELRDIWNPVPGFSPTGHQQETIVITPARLGDDIFDFTTATEFHNGMLAHAIFAGRVDQITRAGPGESFSIGGPSVLAFLGDANGHGPLPSAVTGPATDTLQHRINKAINHIASFVAGFTTTFFWTTASVGITVTDDIDLTSSIRSNLDRLRLFGGDGFGAGVPVEYRATPDMKLLVFDQGDFSHYRGDATFVLGPGLHTEEREGADPVRVVPADLKVVEDYSDFVTFVRENASSGGGLGAAGGASYATPSGTSADINVWINENGAPSSSDLAAKARNRLSTQYTVSYRYTVTVQAEDALRFVSDVGAGARIFVYDPERSQFDTAFPRLVNGRTVGCNLVQLNSITYPLMPGMGVYVVRTSNGDFTVADVSEHVDFDSEPKTLQLQVGNRARTVTGIVRGT